MQMFMCISLKYIFETKWKYFIYLFILYNSFLSFFVTHTFLADIFLF